MHYWSVNNNKKKRWEISLENSISLVQSSHYRKDIVKSYPWYLTKRHVMQTYGGVEVSIHAFSTSAPDGGKWSASRPGRFTPEVRTPVATE
jgi:hypothetical protein